MTSRSLSSHLAVAVLAAVVGWMGASSVHDGDEMSEASVSESTPSRSVGDDASAEQSRGASPNRERRKAEAKGSSAGDFVVFPDGSVKVPPEQLLRLSFSPLEWDFKVDRKELALFGFSDEQCDALQSTLDRTLEESTARESEGAMVLSESPSEMVMKLPAVAKDEQATASLEKELEDLTGGHHSFLVSRLIDQMNELVGSHGTRIIRRDTTDERYTRYEVIELDPEREDGLGPEPTFEEYRSILRSGSSSQSVGDARRYKKLFPPRQ